jgi:4-hydroxy 2-oxovalerate aldolase
MTLLDCTLRDGGYYTNWDFDKSLVHTYVEAFNKLPVDYLEIGYRSQPLEGYLGEYFYCPDYVMRDLKARTNKKLVVILNEKDVRAGDVEALLTPCLGLITMVRLAIDPKNFARALELAAAVKAMGFEVGFNVMYMSTWKSQPEFLAQLSQTKGVCDYFYMVDSFGGVYPEDVKEIYQIVKSQVDVPIGFHGHNNLELALINTLTAIDCGAAIVDATVTGMGRGAGNLKTELLLTALNAKNDFDLDFNALSMVVDGFAKLQETHGWGTNLPYMVSGAHSLPQKEVMDWVGKRYYSFNSIIRALHNQSAGKKDNVKLSPFQPVEKYTIALMIGGGSSVVAHAAGITQLLQNRQDVCVIHASSKNAAVFKDLANPQFFCLVGNEGYRLESVFGTFKHFDYTCVLPPYPRKMGTYIPKQIAEKAAELEKISFTNLVKDSHTALALQTAIELGCQEVWMVGFDGYSGEMMGAKEQELFMENEQLFADVKVAQVHLKSLLPTKYKSLQEDSLYALI